MTLQSCFAGAIRGIPEFDALIIRSSGHSQAIRRDRNAADSSSMALECERALKSLGIMDLGSVIQRASHKVSGIRRAGQAMHLEKCKRERLQSVSHICSQGRVAKSSQCSNDLGTWLCIPSWKRSTQRSSHCNRPRAAASCRLKRRRFQLHFRDLAACAQASDHQQRALAECCPRFQ